MKTFNHIGLVATEEMPGETYYEDLKLWGTDPQIDPNKVEWVRFSPDSPLANTPLTQMPHISYSVDNIEEELGGEEPVVGPIQVAENIRIAYVLIDGALIEYLEVK